jgi:hypothetical protein
MAPILWIGAIFLKWAVAGDLVDFRRFLRWTFALCWGVGGLYLLARFAWPLLPPLDASNPVLHLTSARPALRA